MSRQPLFAVSGRFASLQKLYRRICVWKETRFLQGVERGKHVPDLMLGTG